MGRDVREVKYLERLAKNEKDPLVKDRLRGILLLKKNYHRIEVAKILGVTDRTVYNWKYRYAKKGYEGLQSKSIPGRSTFLDNEDMAKLKELLEKRPYWTAKEIQVLINEEFGRMFVLRQVHRILRKLGMHCGKPYVEDYRRPSNAERDFKKRLQETPLGNNAIIGFGDGSCQYTNVNTTRLWSFEKLRLKKNTSRGEHVNSLGFYALNGKSVYHDTETAKKKDIARFLRVIRHENPSGTIVLVWDNARAHLSRLVRRTARFLNIVLVFLPPYSPDLNPIEFIC